MLLAAPHPKPTRSDSSPWVRSRPLERHILHYDWEDIFDIIEDKKDDNKENEPQSKLKKPRKKRAPLNEAAVAERTAGAALSAVFTVQDAHELPQEPSQIHLQHL